MTKEDWVQYLRKLISNDKLIDTINNLKLALNKSAKLDEIILISARYNDIAKQIQQDVVRFDDANITKNKIRKSLIELVREIEEHSDNVLDIEINAFDYNMEKKIYFDRRKERAKDYNELGRARLRVWADGMMNSKWDWYKLCQSLEYYITAIKWDSNNHHFWRNISYIFYLFGQFSDAEKCLNKSYEMKSPPDEYYHQVRNAISNGTFLTGGKVTRPNLPTNFICPSLKVNLEIYM